jgi:trimeric autotransporter adhesin
MTNPQLALMAALGSCGSLGSTTTISVNELTTVAAVWPLAPFMSSYSAIGSGTADAAALANAFAEAAIFADTTTGRVPGLNVPSGTTVPVEQINTLADALASCTNSNGGVAGDGSACGMLFAAATPPGGAAPVNVIGAGINLANNPTLDSSSIFGLVGGKSPFQPTLTSAPASLAVQLTQTSSGLSYSASAVVFAAAYLNFPSMQQTVKIANNTSEFVEFTGFTVVGADAADFSVGASCPGTPGLYPGQTCQLSIIFNPSVSGARSATVLLGSMVTEIDGASSSTSIPLSGVGLQHAGSSVTLSPSSLTFALAGAPQPVTVTNNGTIPITLNTIYASGDASGTDNCGITLAPQATCTIQVSANYVDTREYMAQAPTGTITVTDSGNPGVQTVAVNVPLGPAYFVASTIAFGNTQVGATSGTMQTRAEGSDPSGPPLFNALITGPNASDFSVVAEGITNSVVSFIYVSFKPTELGPRTATLVTTYGNATLSGIGIPQQSVTNGPAFTISQSSLSLTSPVGTSNPATGLSVTDTGTTGESLIFSITGPAAADFTVTGNLSNAIISATESFQFGITFTPSQIGVRTATLTVTDTFSGLSHSIPLTGIGDPMAPAASSNALTFPTIKTGQTSAAQTVTLSAPNGDPVSLQFTDSGLPASFPIASNTCATQTPCQISVSFAPVMAGTNTAALTVTDVVTNETTTVNFSGSGGTASLSLSSSSLFFASQNVRTTSPSQTVTLTNNGGSALTIESFSFTGGNPEDFLEANTCGTNVASGASCVITISFDPIASGPRSAILEIYSDAASSPDIIQVSGIAN